MDQKELCKRIRKLPDDIIINHIIPYTYSPQPNKLLCDIRSYVHDYGYIDNMYLYDYNYAILLNDLLMYCNNRKQPIYEMESRFALILFRNFKLSKYNSAELQYFVYFRFYKNTPNAEQQKIKFLWGLMNQSERTDFINTYILLDEEFLL
jgi:hypothetical protein